MVTQLREVPAFEPSFGNTVVEEERVVRLDLDVIFPDPNQPRQEFDSNEMEILTESIKAVGQLVPALVRAHPKTLGAFMLVQGERRWRACQMANIPFLKAIVITGDPDDLYIHAAIDNLVRAPLSHLETAQTIANIKRKKKATYGAIAKYFGQSEPWVAQHLTLLRLPPAVHELMVPPIPVKRRLTFSVALLLATLPEDRDKVRFAREFFASQTKFSRAKFMISKRMHQLHLTGQKKIKPHREYEKLSRFTMNLADSSELMKEVSQVSFDIIFANRSLPECERLLEKLNGCQLNLLQIEGGLKREIEKKKKAPKPS